MNSIFSSFDALSAEFLGQSLTSFKTKSPAAAAAITIQDDQKKAKNMTNGSTTGHGSKSGYTARWAPEMDGLNCFESLVFH